MEKFFEENLSLEEVKRRTAFELLPGDLTPTLAAQQKAHTENQLKEARKGLAEAIEKKELAEAKIEKLREAFEQGLDVQLEAGKALALLNSASVAGALAFGQALFAKGAFGDFRFFVVVGTMFFLVGAAAGASTPRALVDPKMAIRAGMDHTKYMRPARLCLSIASIGFAVGALVFVWGLAVVSQ